MNRRGFMGAILAACAAPAIVRADSLMRLAAPEIFVVSPSSGLLVPKADVLWEGAIRECHQYEALRDEHLWRWDVVASGGLLGTLEQVHVMAKVMPGEDVERARAPALTVLRDNLKARGLKPMRGILKLPDGMPVARFL